jgi:CubicO group peptidase (beta-lactamase class C family)
VLAAALILTACQSDDQKSSPAAGLDADESVSVDVVLSDQSGTENGADTDRTEDGELLAEVETTEEPVYRLTQEDIDEALEMVMENYSATAVAVAVIEDGQVTQSGAWGWAVKDKREMTADTKMWAASLTKVAVGMCAMAMYEDGVVDLDAPLSDYWGSGAVNPYSKAQPSIRTLMSHSSSLKALDGGYGLSKLKSVLNSSSSWRSVEPGDGGYWYYNNFAFRILGTTLELAENQVLDDYLQERFLQPLGITASLFGGNLDKDEMACVYSTGDTLQLSLEKQSWTTSPDIGGGAYNYAGGLTISAKDLAKLVAVLANGGSYDGVEYLSPETVALMEEVQFTVDLEDTPTFQQCLVLRRQENALGQDVLYYHTGSAYGAFNLLSFNPETGNGVVVLTTGTARKTNENGIYALCADLSTELYARMEGTKE